MAHNLKYSDALKDAKLNAITTLLGAAALLRFYDGAQPDSPNDGVTTQNMLAELVCADPTFGAAAAEGVLTAHAIASGAGLAAAGAGTDATWFRLCKADGTAVLDGTVGIGVDYDCNVVNTNIAEDQPVQVSGFAITSAN